MTISIEKLNAPVTGHALSAVITAVNNTYATKVEAGNGLTVSDITPTSATVHDVEEYVGSDVFLRKTDAASTYLTKTNAEATYAKKVDIPVDVDLSNYLTVNAAVNAYLFKTDAASTYLSKTDAASTYLTQAAAGTTYLTQTAAGNTYALKTDIDKKVSATSEVQGYTPTAINFVITELSTLSNNASSGNAGAGE